MASILCSGNGGPAVSNVHALYSNDPSSNPVDIKMSITFIVLDENRWKRGCGGLPCFVKYNSCVFTLMLTLTTEDNLSKDYRMSTNSVMLKLSYRFLPKLCSLFKNVKKYKMQIVL